METRPATLQDPLRALSEIAEAINTLQEPNALLEKVLEIAMETLEAERGFILLTSDTQPEGFDVAIRRNFTEEQLGDVVRLSTSVVYEVLRKGEPVLLYEALTDDRFGGAESIVLQQIQSIACVPLRLKNRQVGAIYLDSLTQRGRFTRDHLPFLNAFANQAAVAATVRGLGGDRAAVDLVAPQAAIAPGQACVVYHGERVLGGGWIERAEARFAA